MTLPFIKHGFDREPEKECFKDNANSTLVNISLREALIRQHTLEARWPRCSWGPTTANVSLSQVASGAYYNRYAQFRRKHGEMDEVPLQ